MTQTVETKGFVDSVREGMESTKVRVYCNAGTFPLEWPKRPDGTRSVDEYHYAQQGNKVTRIGQTKFRNIETTTERGQSLGFMELDLDDHSNPAESDAEFLARIEDFLESSRDPRIEKCGVRVEYSQPYPMPFGKWDELKPKSVLEMVALQMGDDPEANADMLTAYAKYELSRIPTKHQLDRHPRQEVLDGLDFLARASGDESDDDAGVIDESGD